MTMNTLRQIAVVLAAATLLAGCGSSEEPAEESPVTLTTVEGTDLKQVALTEPAVDRLGIETATVQEEKVAVGVGAPSTHKVIPYAAVVYDSDGSTWTYVSTEPRTYVRAPITVTTIQGDTAILSAGPETGTAVVVVGAPELLGAEVEISGEE
jgi:hypothetical protein